MKSRATRKTRNSAPPRRSLAALQADALSSAAQTSSYAAILAPRVQALRAAAVAAKLLAVLGLIAAVALLVRYLWPAVAAANGTGGGSTSPDGGGGTAAGGPVSGLAFSDFDQNGDGRIGEDEVRAELESRGFRPTDQELHVIMVNSDADSSGAVGPAEFDKLVSEVQKVTGLLTPLLPWWAYLLILLGVLSITLGVAWYAWKGGKWMTLYWAIFLTGIVICVVESQLYGVVFGQYVAGLGAGLIAFTYFLRYMKRTFIDPLAEKMNTSAEWAKRKADEVTESLGAVRDYVTGTAASAIKTAQDLTEKVGDAANDLGEGAVGAGKELGKAGEKVAEASRKAALNPLDTGGRILKAVDETILPKGPSPAEEAGEALKRVENMRMPLNLGQEASDGSEGAKQPSAFAKRLMLWEQRSGSGSGSGSSSGGSNSSFFLGEGSNRSVGSAPGGGGE